MVQLSAEHHFIPKAILRHFCFKGETLWYYTKATTERRIEERNVNSVFKKRHLNTYHHDDNRRDDGLERWFASEFDNEIAKVIARIQQEMKAPGSSGSLLDKQFLVQFIYNHMKRTPDIFRSINVEERLLSIAQQAIEDSGDTIELEEVLPHEDRGRWISNAIVAVRARQSEKVLEALRQLKLVLAVPGDPKSSFIIGSSPVVRLSHNGRLNLRTGDIELGHL